MGRLDDKVCLISGGSRGLGAATGELMIREGATVAPAVHSAVATRRSWARPVRWGELAATTRWSWPPRVSPTREPS